MKYHNFFLLLWVILALLVPDPDSEYKSGFGYTDPIESASATLVGDIGKKKEGPRYGISVQIRIPEWRYNR
jgi:hypothetical protein